MRFVFDGYVYRIRFQHEHHPDETAFYHCIPIMAGGTKHGKVRAVTTCYIEVKRNDRWDIIAEGIARCSLDDRFQKEVGRKLSLQRALTGMTKEFRTSGWATYIVRSPKIIKLRKEN